MRKKQPKAQAPQKSWQQFERLVAALHRAQVKGATVHWDDTIGGRQFDVTVIFRDGLYEHLTVVECKERSSALSVEQVDAFVTKSRDVNANKAIMVSASGFQSGCLTVAKNHGIELFTLTETEKLSDEELDSTFTPTIAYNICGVRLILSADGNDAYELPEDRNRLPYFFKHSVIEVPGRPQQLLGSYLVKAARSITVNFEEREAQVSCPYGTLVRLAETEIEIPIRGFRFTHRLVTAYSVPEGLDAYASMRMNAMVDYTDVLAGKTHQLPAPHEIGFSTEMKPGSFYENHMRFYYYCNRVEGDLMWLDLVESYQHGDLLQAWGGAQKLKYANYYVEVTDPNLIARLQELVERHRRRSGE